MTYAFEKLAEKLFRFGALSAIPITVLVVMDASLVGRLMSGTGLQVLEPGAAVLAAFTVMAFFVLVLQLSVIDDASPHKSVERHIATAAFVLWTLLLAVSGRISKSLRSALLCPNLTLATMLLSHPTPPSKPSSSPCWPHGHPKILYN